MEGMTAGTEENAGLLCEVHDFSKVSKVSDRPLKNGRLLTRSKDNLYLCSYAVGT